MRADLHMHTTNSDGAFSALEVADMAKRRGLDIIAITDHDVFSDTTEIRVDGLRLIYGVEVSSLCNGENIHILAYFNNYPSSTFLNYLNEVKGRRRKRANKICDLLEEHFQIKLDRSFINKPNAITRGEIYREMVKQGYHYSNTYVFNEILGTGCPCYVPTVEVGVKEIIDFVKSNNGLAVLAHPMLYKKENLEQIIDLGFDGMEVKYPNFEDSYSKYLHMAKKRNMFITAGSDFHSLAELSNPGSKHGHIGQVYLSGHDLDIFLKNLEMR